MQEGKARRITREIRMADRFMDLSYPKIQAGERPNSGTDYAPTLAEGSQGGTAATKIF